MNEKLLMRISGALMKEHRLPFTNPTPLARVLQRCFIQKLEDGNVLCEEKQAGDELFFLLKGQISVVKKDMLGQSRELVVMDPPTMFGHMALIEERPRSATCLAKGDTVVAVMGRNVYRRCLDDGGAEGTAFRHLLIGSMAKALHESNGRLFKLLGPDDQADDSADAEELQSASDSLSGWKGKKGARR